MAGASGGRTLEETPTWAVAIVCFVLVFISIIIEHTIHLIGKWLTKKHKRALYESLEKIKSELMLLGFLSLLLTVGQGPISDICISKSIGATWHPCKKSRDDHAKYYPKNKPDHRRLLTIMSGDQDSRRVLAGAAPDKCAESGKVPFVSSEGIHQLHMFIFVLAVFHVLYCVLTLVFGRLKMRKWKSWETETKTVEYQFAHDPERFRFARETSFGRRHVSFWTKTPVLMWIVCFFRQFVRSVPKIDYLTLRHGFIMEHLAPHSQINFNFQKYINRSLEEDFKVVVGISPPVWFAAVLFLLFNTHGWFSYLWLPFVPLIIILLVGTKLQVIITQMGLRIQKSGEVVKGEPVVELGDHLFWFNRPRLVLYLINFVLFQNAFQLAFLAWTWYEFRWGSCFHENSGDIIIRLSMGVLIQILCSYVTLPLHALVTQMGTTMKLTIFNENVARALRNWHHTAKKHVKQNNKAGSKSATPTSSRPATPTRLKSPVHLLRRYRSEPESLQYSNWETESPSPSHHQLYGDGLLTLSQHGHVEFDQDVDEPSFALETIMAVTESPEDAEQRDQTVQHEIDQTEQHEIDIASKDFTFDGKSGK